MDVVEYKLKVVVHKSCKGVAAHGTENIDVFRRKYTVYRRFEGGFLDHHHGSFYSFNIL